MKVSRGNQGVKYPIDALRGLLVVLGGVIVAQLVLVADVPPQAEAALKAKVGPNITESSPDWPQPVKAPAGAPNVVLILLDDVGFADASTFGGVAQTPELDRLAAHGLRYINFNTAAMCSPTRAALLSGRNHHHIGFGRIQDLPDALPGYDTVWKKNAVSIADVLQRNGYSTAAFGKWHNTPFWEIGPVGPFEHWPTSLGFEYFYGFMSGAESQWEPSNLYRDTTAVEPPATPQQGYHFTTDITNEAINWVRTHETLASQKPYFLYFATGATHEPHHVPKEWIEKYRGKFDQGWDKLRQEIFARQKKLGVIPANADLTPRPEGLPAWDSLTADQKRLYARQMEVYAGYLAHTDHEVGRLLQTVQQGPHGDNTLVLYIVGDNGSSGMGGLDGTMEGNGDSSLRSQLQHIDELGGPLHINNYAVGWAWAGVTPFQGMKGIASHFGGVRDPLIVSWPARIREQGELRMQFTHANDIAATVYEAARVRIPLVVDGVQQIPLDGTSFIDSFDRADAAQHHRIQYFEMWGNRAIYHDGWIAAARHDSVWQAGGGKGDLMKDRWELYHVAEDFSEAHDLAARYPDKLRALQALFDAEARRNDVYPLGLDSTKLWRKSSWRVGIDRGNFIYGPGLPRIPLQAAPAFGQFSFRITANVTIPQSGAQGVVVSYGGRFGGFALYVKDDRLVCDFNGSAGYETLRSTVALPHGELVLAYEFWRNKPSNVADPSFNSDEGTARLYVNGRPAGEIKLASAGAIVNDVNGYFGIGQAYGTPVSPAFQLPFKFSGTLTKVQVELK